MPPPNRLERRSQLLAQTMVDTSTGLASALGAGERPAFTTPLTRNAALEWWNQHIGDDYGRRVLEQMTPEKILQLHLDLQQWKNEVADQAVRDNLARRFALGPMRPAADPEAAA